MRIKRSLLSIALAAAVTAPAAAMTGAVVTAPPAGACQLLGCTASVFGLLSGGSIIPGSDGSVFATSSFIGVVLNTPVVVTGSVQLQVQPDNSAHLNTSDTFGHSSQQGTVTRTNNLLIFRGGNESATFFFNGPAVLGGHLTTQESSATT